MNRSLPWLGLVLALGLSSACKEPVDDTAVDEEVHPHLMVTPDDKEVILARIDTEPWASVYAHLLDVAAREYEDDPDPNVWSENANGHNGDTAQANAFIAWLHDDEAAATKAKDFLDRLETDWETNETWDINIRMPHTLIPYTNAVDLLLGTPWMTEEEAAAAEAKITEINDKFFRAFVLDDVTRGTVLGFAQNNHPIRTASAIAYVGLAFPDHRESEEWVNWGISELDYLWGPNGQYVQADGGVSEGPFYYGFAFAPSVAIFIAMDNGIDPERVYARDCANRNDSDPWSGHGCVDGEAFTFDNPLHGDSFRATAEWWVSLRLPSGNCPPLADANMNPLNGAALLTSFGGGPELRWNWENNTFRPLEDDWGLDLIGHHLAYVSDVEPAEPTYTTRFMPDAGEAVFRSGWDSEALWFMLVAENGSARKTLHDHVDGTSFSLAAYGEYLLVDPGYYKPFELNNAITSSPRSHNVILIDGNGAPAKGLLSDFGDADAFLENTYDGAVVDYAEAHQSYRSTDIERSAVYLRDRYVLIADRLATSETEPREHAWRLGGYAGFGSGGTFDVRADGARWERTTGGVEVFLASTDAGLEILEPPYTPLDSPHVHQFDVTREQTDHGVIDGAVSAVAPGFLAVLAPYRVGAVDADGPLDVQPLPLGPGVAAWSITTASGTDIAIARSPTAPTSFVLPDSTVVETDAELVVFALDSDDFALVADGTSLSVGGTNLIDGNSAQYAVIENR